MEHDDTYDIYLLNDFLELPVGALNNFYIRQQKLGTKLKRSEVTLDIILLYLDFRYDLPMCSERHKKLIRKARKHLDWFVIKKTPVKSDQ
jgi:hypothetical protein